MNQLTVVSRALRNELINAADFASNTGEEATYFKALTWERVRYTLNYTIQTSVSATLSTEITFSTNTSEATWTHPYANWATEGFKVGDSIKILNGTGNIVETVTSISANVMKTTDSGITAALTIVSGTSYPDLVFRNQTTPTSLLYKFGVVPNGGVGFSGSGSTYASLLDGQIQAYKTNALSGSPVALTGTMVPNAEITESLTADLVSTTDSWIFQIEVVHTFRVPGYNEGFLSVLNSGTTPIQYQFPNSFKYVSESTIGTDVNDPNEYRKVTDNLLDGAVGWVDNNFTAGSGDYELNSIVYTVGTANPSQVEVSATTTVSGSIKKNSGNWVAGDRVVLYVSKLPSAADYSGNINTWATNFVFDTVVTTEGAADASSDIIQIFSVDIDSGDSTLLNFYFRLTYDSAQQTLIDNGDYYFLGMQVGEDSDTWEASDRMIVTLDVNQFYKNMDVTGLITSNTCRIYSSEKTPLVGTPTTNIGSWDNRLHIAAWTFDLLKVSGAGIGDAYSTKIKAVKGQLISKNSTTGETFVITGSEFEFPMGSDIEILVAGTSYQAKNITGFRDFNIKPDALQNKYYLASSVPGVFDATQAWDVYFPFVVPWRANQASLTVPTTFYDSTKPNNNLNAKSSNYSLVGDWDIYVRLLVTVNFNGIDTDYGLMSTESYVRDFDEDPPTYDWTATTVLYDENDNVVNYFIEGQDIRVETTWEMATAGTITTADIYAEFTIEEYNSTGDNCRLHSSVDWYYPGNLLKPLDGEQYVKVTHDVANNRVITECLIDHNYIDVTKSYNIMPHLLHTK